MGGRVSRQLPTAVLGVGGHLTVGDVLRRGVLVWVPRSMPVTVRDDERTAFDRAFEARRRLVRGGRADPQDLGRATASWRAFHGPTYLVSSGHGEAARRIR